MAESTNMARIAALTAEERKGSDLRILDIRSISSIADTFVICSGANNTHVQAIADHVEEALTLRGMKLHHMEGYRNGRWILLDFGDIVIHVMHAEERAFYNLERLWGDATEVPMLRSEAG